MKEENIHILSPGDEWDEVIDNFSTHHQSDVYFDHRYLSLYSGDDEVCLAYLYQEPPHQFFFPILLRPIHSDILPDGYYDFESPYGYSGPLATSTNPHFLREAWDSFYDYCGKQKIIAGFVRFHPLLKNINLVDNNLIIPIFDRETVVLTLDKSEEEVWQGYSKDNRNKIRKAIKNGVLVTSYNTREALETFAGLYSQRMQELKATQEYRFSHQYFKNISNLGNDKYQVLLAKYEEEIIGGALLLFSDHFAHYHLSASPKRYSYLAPNNILRHTAIMRLLGKKYTLIHFGGGKTTHPNDSLLEFKKRFSKETAMYYIGKCIIDKKSYHTLCNDWENKNPDKIAEYGRYLLRYRM